MGRSNSSRLSLASLHDAARKGDSRSLQRLIRIIDPTAAEKVAAVLLQRDNRESVSPSAAGTDPSLSKKVEGSQNATGGPQTRIAKAKRGTAKKTLASPLKRLLQKQDAKRRTALYLACAAGNTEVADTLLAVGANSEGHGAWQRTPLHIAAFEAHTSAMRSLLGAGADPWAMNGRGQTPSDVSYMYNANGIVLELLEQAVDMRRVICTGGLVGAIFVHDDGQVGKLTAVIEQWSFTLEVELDQWKLGNRSGAKVYIPVRGQRYHASTRPSLDKLAASTGHSKARNTQPQRKRCKQSIPWLAKTVGRMRLESDGLLKVDAGSLVGARANTPVGRGAVISVRDVSVRCEIETVRMHNADLVENFSSKTMNTTYNCSGGRTHSDAGEGQRASSVKATPTYHHPRTTECDSFSPSVMGREPTDSPGSLCVDESNRRMVGQGGQDKDGAEAPDRGKRQGERCEDAMPLPTIFRRSLNGRIIHVASKNGPPGNSGPYCQVGDNVRRLRSGDNNDNNVAWDGCSEGTDRAAEFDEWAATSVHERTREDFEQEQAGAGSWTAHAGAVSHTRRHAFQDNLVPLAALEGVVDCHTLPPSATTCLSRARSHRRRAQSLSRVTVSPATPSQLAPHQIRQPHTATPQRWPTSAMLEVDDLVLDRESSPGSERENIGAGGNGVQVEIVGLEERIEREERSEERLDKKRINMEATRSAVAEALVLWNSKADLLQARLVVLRTAASTVSGPTTSTIASTSESNNTVSLEEYLASPSPRCCACDKRGGYRQAKSTTSSVPLSDTHPSVALPAGRISNDDGRQSTASDRCSGACAKKNRSHDDGLANGVSSRRGSMDSREEQLVVHLQECLAHMTHLRNWLRLLDQELG